MWGGPSWRTKGVRRSDALASSDQVDDEDHQGHDQQDVDETTSELGDEADEPEDQEDHDDEPENACHEFFLSGARAVCTRE